MHDEEIAGTVPCEASSMGRKDISFPKVDLKRLTSTTQELECKLSKHNLSQMGYPSPV